MNADQEKLIEVLSNAAALQDAVERAAYLDVACRERPDLRAEIETLLRARERAGDFLEASVELRRAPPVDHCVGTSIGRYQLLQEIGEGGFGVVYLAKQVEPVRRRVALKIIKPGMDTREVIARFEAERQALALMDQPNIAKVLDAGTTENERSYFVMELQSHPQVPGLRVPDVLQQGWPLVGPLCEWPNGPGARSGPSAKGSRLGREPGEGFVQRRVQSGWPMDRAGRRRAAMLGCPCRTTSMV